jgi:hypothetical protein
LLFFSLWNLPLSSYPLEYRVKFPGT